MTSSQRIALAAAFERLSARIAAQPVTPPHPVIERRKAIVVKARRGSYRRRMIHSEE